MSVTLGEARLYTNHLLAKLTDEQLEPLCPMLERIHTNIKHVVHERNGTIPYVYFPNTSALSNLMGGMFVPLLVLRFVVSCSHHAPGLLFSQRMNVHARRQNNVSQ